MAILKNAQVFELIKHPRNRYLIDRAIEIKHHHELHIAGIGLKTWLKKVDGIDNEAALKTRRQLANAATISVMASALKPFNKIFTASGTTRKYNIKNEDEQIRFRGEILENIAGNKSIESFMKIEWSEKVNIDPLGMFLVEIEPDGEELTTVYKSCETYHDIEYYSIDKIDYVIFNPTIGKDGEKYYRVIDDKYDRIVMVNDDKYSVLENRKVVLNDGRKVSYKTYPNHFGYVPGVIISDRNDKRSHGQDTWISESIPSADDYLFDAAIHKVYKTKVGLPIHYETERTCPQCEGNGALSNGDECPLCQGAGYAINRDISDKIILPFPEDSDSPELKHIAGFINPDASSQKMMIEELNRLKREIYAAIWGSSAYVEKGNNATAFEIAVNKEPETDKLMMVSRNADIVETAITNLYGIFFIDGYNGANVRYGSKYALRSSDGLLKEYQEAQGKGLTSTILNELLLQYYQSEYENNEQAFTRAVKLMNLEPYVHQSVEIVAEKLKPSAELYMIKLNFSQYITRFEEEKGRIALFSLEEIEKELDRYATEDLNNYRSIESQVASFSATP